VRHAAKPRIHVFIATSKIHMEKKLRMTPEQVKAEAQAAVARSRGYCDDVEFSPEDGYRSDPDFMCEVCQIAVDNGATTINIPDTVGFAVPEDYGKLIRYVIEQVRGDFTVSTHCHDDLGLAVANSLAGVVNGARQIECAVNGLGERAGNAALEEVVMAIKTRGDYFENCDVRVRTEELARTSRLVARLTGYPVQYNKAVVGRNAFAHEAGIHQHGVLQDRETYEIIDASTVGQEAAQIVLGKHSGRHAFADTLTKMGLNIQGDALNAAFVRFKELADKKVELTEADLEAIVAEELGTDMVHRYSVHELELHGGTATKPTAHVVLVTADEKVEAGGSGDGMIDAAIAAISQATGIHGKVGNFQVASVTGGSDALGAVAITVEADGRKVTGRGVATDVVEASARAYLNAVNKIVRLAARNDTREVEEVGP
jgi:2-isopropylmalate synthase